MICGDRLSHEYSHGSISCPLESVKCAVLNIVAATQFAGPRTVC